MKLTKWVNVFVLATTATFITGCEPGGESTSKPPAAAPEGSSGTGGGVETPSIDAPAPAGTAVEEPAAAPEEEPAAPAE